MNDKSEQRPPHKWVANKIGFSIPGVSLLRGGLRQPSITTMEAVEEAFDWSMRDQIDARHDYAAELERVLERAYAKEQAEEVFATEDVEVAETTVEHGVES